MIFFWPVRYCCGQQQRRSLCSSLARWFPSSLRCAVPPAQLIAHDDMINRFVSDRPGLYLMGA